MKKPKEIEVKVNSGNITFVTLIQVAFIILKLCNVINWSWWLVFLPTLIELGIVILILVIILIAAAIATIK
jgi:hypothetical protein